MKTAAMLLLLTTSAFAQTPPATEGFSGVDESTKQWALQRAYVVNNNSMVGSGVDVSKQWPPKTISILPIKPGQIIPEVLPVPHASSALKPKDQSMMVVDWAEKNDLDKAADRKIETNVCTIHHMRKVTTADGLSWHCRK